MRGVIFEKALKFSIRVVKIIASLRFLNTRAILNVDSIELSDSFVSVLTEALCH
jgi:hypothetical protein